MTFFLDLWHDLREKRLWPVAVGLLAAAVAIPAIMLKPAEEIAPPAIAASADAPEELPAVQLDDAAPAGSKLETYSQRNPFRPLADLEEETTGLPAGGSSGSSGATSAGEPAAGPSTAGSSAGSSTPSRPAGGDSGSAPAASTGGGGGSTTTPTSEPSEPAVQWFRYTADIRFGERGSRKKMKDVESLTLLPNDEAPAIVFMGVGADAKSAIFFIANPSFTAEGEGKCNDKDNCRFVKLRLADGANEHSFISEDGSTRYELKLIGLNRENISDAQAKGDADDSKGRPAATIQDGSDSFLPRLLYRPSVARETK